MKQVQLATKKHQWLISLMDTMTYLYMWDISEVKSDFMGLIKKAALFSGLET